jgi:hypothetical protein
MMSTKQDLLSNTRHSYPYLVKTDYKFDLDKLREEMVAIEKQNGWEDMTNQSELVAGLIQGRKRLTSAFANEGGEYDDYKQMIVTDINRDTVNETDFAQVDDSEKFATYKTDMKRSTAIQDETLYGNLRSVMEVAPYTSKMLESFPDPLARVRYAKIKPNFAIKPHIDYNTTYGMRYHIALHTNDKCKVGFRRNKTQDFEEFHIPADGHLYYFNQGFEHFANNYSDEERIHIVIGLGGQQLMEPYKIK